jgi:small subunit ribosomal protein S4
VSPTDIIEVKASSRELTPFLAAINDAGLRTVPGWLEAIPTQLRILVHSLPEREAIDTEVQEQLIVEFYSK